MAIDFHHAHLVKTTSFARCYDVKIVKRNVVAIEGKISLLFFLVQN